MIKFMKISFCGKIFLIKLLSFACKLLDLILLPLHMRLSILKTKMISGFASRFSRKDQVKFVEDSLGADHIASFLKAVLHKFYLVHS